MMQSFVSQSFVSMLMLVGLMCHCHCATAQGQADKIDTDRAQRYVEKLVELQEARVQLRKRAASLLAQNPNLEQEFVASMRTQLVTAGALEVTPAFIATPQLLQTYQAYLGRRGDITLQPQLLIWYALQDNTLLRQQLFFNLAAAQRDATITYATMQSSRVALEQVAQHADENFLKFRRLGDMLGRRSPAEMAELEAITSNWLKDDPLHAGASLLQAYALRSSGRYDECKKLIETLDNNYPLMQSIVSTIYAQIAFLNGSANETKRMLDKAIAQSQQSGSAEAAIIYGWIMMTEQRWDKARSYAAKARQLQADNVEVAILEGLATAYEKPGRSRDGIQALRRGQLNASPDDWHYREALAIVHQIAGDHQFAKREIAAAIAVAPGFIRKELESEQAEIENGNLPAIDWSARLKTAVEQVNLTKNWGTKNYLGCGSVARAAFSSISWVPCLASSTIFRWHRWLVCWPALLHRLPLSFLERLDQLFDRYSRLSLPVQRSPH